MASPRSPFREHAVNNNGSPSTRSSSTSRSSPSHHGSFFPPDTPWLLDPDHDNTDKNKDTQERLLLSTNDENVIRATYSYSPSKRRGSSTTATVDSKIINNSLSKFHSSGKARSMDESMIAAMRHHTSLIDMTATLTCKSTMDEEESRNVSGDQNPEEDQQQKQQRVVKVISPEEEATVLHSNRQDVVSTTVSSDNPFDGIVESKEEGRDAKDEETKGSFVVETVTSDVSEAAAQKSLEPSNNVVTIDLSDTAMLSLRQNQFDQIIDSAPSYPSSDDSFRIPKPTESQSEGSGDTVHETKLDSVSKTENFAEINDDDDEDDDTESLSLLKDMAKSKEVSSLLISGKSTTPPKKPSLELQQHDCLSPMSPKDRYFTAVRQAALKCKDTTSYTPMSPKDRYLMAVRQAAAKCKTMVSTPKEIVTGPNPTPKSSVKAQIKRMKQDGLRDGNSCNNEDAATRIRFISTSPIPFEPAFTKKDSDEEDNDQPSEYGSPLFDETTEYSFDDDDDDDAPSEPQRPNNSPRKVHPKGAPSAFRSFHQEISFEELPVKREIQAGNENSPVKSYLQLDLEASGSIHKRAEYNKNQTMPNDSDKTDTVGPMDSLRTSLAMIWNSKPKAKLAGSGRNEMAQTSGGKRSSSSTAPYASVISPKEILDKSTTLDQNDPCCQAPNESGVGAMESLRSSLMVIWNSKPRPKLMQSNSTTAIPDSKQKECGLDAAAPWRNKEVGCEKEDTSFDGSSGFSGCGELPDCKRGRVLSEDSDASSYKRVPSKKKTRCNDSLSARERSSTTRDARLPMGSQYLASCDRERSSSRERTITPIPPEEEAYNSGSLLGQRKHSSNSPEKDVFQIHSRGLPKVYHQNPSVYRVAPSPVKPVDTNDTEDSFTNVALKARNVNDVVVIYSGTPDIRDWHPHEQERKEHDTMVRAILERPSLIDKSIREPRQPRHWEWAQIRKWILIGLVMLVFIVTIAGCLACGITGSCVRTKEEVQPIDEEEEEARPFSLNLPPYTQESLKSLHSAQTKAYLWMENDPNRNEYGEYRMLQRFALATLYYSTKIAQNWTVATSWMSYDLHECYWFSSFEGMDVCESDEIKHLVLSKNNLRGNIPPELALMTSLVEIDLSRNVLIGPIPTQLSALTNLETLSLEKNELNRIPNEIGLLTSLTSLSIATNEIKGTMPSQLGNLSKLKSLRVFYNFLTGSLPSEVGRLTNLEIFDVDVNNLSGKIPTQIGLMTNLQELWLDWNSFTGGIPTELGLLENLVKLYLGRAFVEGDLRDDGWKGSGEYVIPSELGVLSNLKELYLDNNDLTGLIPTELSHLTNLERATLSGNFITDTIAPGICSLFRGELESLSIDCSEIFCSCGCTCV